jgi:ElaB/YqjD/DUF883 family membrane-anchored ribosome-binding protein
MEQEGSRLRESASGFVRDGVSSMDRLVDGIRRLDLQGATDILAEQVRRRPVQMLLLAAVSGLFVGALLRRE